MNGTAGSSFLARTARLYLGILLFQIFSLLLAGWPARSPTARDFLTRPTLRLFCNRFPGTCHQPGRGPSNILRLSLREWPRMPLTARIERYDCSLQARSFALPWNGTRASPPAAVERAHSDRARSGSKGSARVSFHPPFLDKKKERRL
jgi:hypothetical protein